MQRIEHSKTETQLLIDKAIIAKTEAEKERQDLVTTYNLKKQQIEEEKNLIKSQIKDKAKLMLIEYNSYRTLIQQRNSLENQYFDIFKRKIEEQKKSAQNVIDMYSKLNIMQTTSKVS
jgi:hypothetical protein